MFRVAKQVRQETNMTYKNEELEAEFNARYDSVREAYAATAADADLMGNDDYGRAESEDNIRDMVAALLPTLSDEKVAKLEAWFAGQLPFDQEKQAVRKGNDFAFTCTDCKTDFYHPHEGNYGREEDLSDLCVDCHITCLVWCNSD